MEVKNILNRLYDGEIVPCEQIIPQSREYTETMEKIDAEMKKWEQKLSKPDFVDLQDGLQSLPTQECALFNEASFIAGFKMAVQLILESIRHTA